MTEVVEEINEDIPEPVEVVEAADEVIVAPEDIPLPEPEPVEVLDT